VGVMLAVKIRGKFPDSKGVSEKLGGGTPDILSENMDTVLEPPRKDYLGLEKNLTHLREGGGKPPCLAGAGQQLGRRKMGGCPDNAKLL